MAHDLTLTSYSPRPEYEESAQSGNLGHEIETLAKHVPVSFWGRARILKHENSALGHVSLNLTEVAA